MNLWEWLNDNVGEGGYDLGGSPTELKKQYIIGTCRECKHKEDGSPLCHMRVGLWEDNDGCLKSWQKKEEEE